MYYTYAYLREDGTPYYIGKGKGRRAYVKENHKIPLPPKDKILILKKNLTEEEAYKHEKYMVGVFGRKDNGLAYSATSQMVAREEATGTKKGEINTPPE